MAGSPLVTVVGGGPAGAAAAITAARHGAAVRVYEQSAFPRHKVCGEYLTPEILPLIDALGLRTAFDALGPHKYSRLSLHFPRSAKHCALPERAYGLSRWAFDSLLLGAAGEVTRGRPPANMAGPAVVAHGRAAVVQGPRQFGFKAHHRGPSTDSIELFFFDGFYVGVNGVEGGVTNVCGLGPEDALRRAGFEPDPVFQRFAPLRERLRPLTRVMDWLVTGPLVYRQHFHEPAAPDRYLAGDALSFVDPFTGSGLTSALVSGMSAGLSAARGEPPSAHYARCRRALRQPFLAAALFRSAIRSGLADLALPLIPGPWLVSLTRPRAGAIVRELPTDFRVPVA